MASGYELPRCQVELPEGRQCGHTMKPLAERDPSFGPSWKPGHWVFQCTYCGGIRALSKETLDRYVSRRR